MRYINEAGLDIIKEFEGLRLIAYLCPNDVPTIGWGHTKTVLLEDVGLKNITEPDAEKLLRKDVSEAEAAVFRAVNVPTTDNQFSALVSWTFNLGAGNLRRSTMLKRINENQLEVVPFEMRRWNRSGGVVLAGLKRRRAAESKLFSEEFAKKDISPENLKNYTGF